jgi:hypothetical protein
VAYTSSEAGITGTYTNHFIDSNMTIEEWITKNITKDFLRSVLINTPF